MPRAEAISKLHFQTNEGKKKGKDALDVKLKGECDFEKSLSSSLLVPPSHLRLPHLPVISPVQWEAAFAGLLTS